MTEPEVQFNDELDGEPLPRMWSGHITVEWEGESHRISVEEVENSSDGPYRRFIVEGGVPIEWFDESLASAIASALSRRMHAIPEFK